MWGESLTIYQCTCPYNQGAYGESQCASQQDLAAVKADMQREMDQIHTKLQYWQNTILRDQHNIHNK